MANLKLIVIEHGDARNGFQDNHWVFDLVLPANEPILPEYLEAYKKMRLKQCQDTTEQVCTAYWDL